VSHTEPHFCTNGPAGDLMILIAAWIAHQELLRNSQRTQPYGEIEVMHPKTAVALRPTS
jgi:hypothetical protein